MPLYELVVAKGGSKLKETAPGVHASIHIESNSVTAQLMGIGPLVTFLTYQVQRPIVDRTNLTGKYDVNLKFIPERAAAGGVDNGAPGEDNVSIFTALEEQLGLKLVSGKGPVVTLVIDHAEKPLEN